MQCPDCGSTDIDVAIDSQFDLQCLECLAEFDYDDVGDDMDWEFWEEDI